MLKKLLFSFAFITLSLSASAQFEGKINPFALLWGSADISAEYVINDNIGVDFAPTLSFSDAVLNNVDYSSTRFGVVINPRYYFSPNRGGDKFYFGGYIKYMNGSFKDSNDVVGWKNVRFAGGFNVGYKVVAESGFLFDIGFGGGKAFVNENTSETGLDLSALDLINIDFVGKLAVGWRF